MGNRVVVVEDEADIRHLVRLTLGFDERLEVCAEAASGEEALRAVADEHPDLIVVDQWLRGPMTGLDVARQVRLLGPSPLIVLFTASADIVDSERVVDRIVLKDDIDRLGEVLATMLGPS